MLGVSTTVVTAELVFMSESISKYDILPGEPVHEPAVPTLEKLQPG